jgi:DNA-binding NtrC family response regulator
VHNLAVRDPEAWPLVVEAVEKAKSNRSSEYIVGESPPMRRLFSEIRRFAPTDLTVLITGESGTGKELVARALHERAPRRSKGPFVAINCAALTATLIGSELFGHEKGAFTGANTRRIGLLEHANGGTIFLDEIGDLPLEQQGHLLRFLEQRTIIRIGGNKEIPLDVRVIAATHVPLEERINQKLFRQDLFYRLTALSLHLPPLRERGEDIKLLAKYFLQENNREFGRSFVGFSPEAIALLETYDWPGNVREMISVIRRAVVMGTEPTITVEQLGLRQEVGEPRGGKPGLTAQALHQSRATRLADQRGAVGEAPHDPSSNNPSPSSSSPTAPERIKEALAAAGGRHAVAAKMLGISRATLFRHLRKLKPS